MYAELQNFPIECQQEYLIFFETWIQVASVQVNAYNLLNSTPPGGGEFRQYIP